MINYHAHDKYILFDGWKAISSHIAFTHQIIDLLYTTVI